MVKLVIKYLDKMKQYGITAIVIFKTCMYKNTSSTKRHLQHISTYCTQNSIQTCILVCVLTLVAMQAFNNHLVRIFILASPCLTLPLLRELKKVKHKVDSSVIPTPSRLLKLYPEDTTIETWKMPVIVIAPDGVVVTEINNRTPSKLKPTGFGLGYRLAFEERVSFSQPCEMFMVRTHNKNTEVSPTQELSLRVS